ncbi:hypothetical protein CAPTEDRAFT_224514 [Capitella teleta]|uniref:Uncharacterized protein n=1 Tax=Capitella teleta TaxID=283909 RepID=R7TTE3_CAPTE|nr:hypothetical protein CAPTEDRAFT_224514 [Capitella teleta]|eukprot:ELT96867.1 hypothetical protein CAPTEDRAFT_224514 [Capitella teleta]
MQEHSSQVLRMSYTLTRAQYKTNSGSSPSPRLSMHPSSLTEMMETTMDIELDMAQIQKQINCILNMQRPLSSGSSTQRRPVLGISGARDNYSLKDHLFSGGAATPRAQPNRKGRRRRMHDVSEEFTLSYDASTVFGDVSKKLDDVANPALHDISIIAPRSPLMEQVSTNESHLQRIQFDAHDQPLHSTLNYPLHSTLAMSLDASNVSHGDETVIRVDTTLRDTHHPEETEYDVDATMSCSGITSALDLEASLGPNPSMMNWLKQRPDSHRFTTPKKQTGSAYDSMISNHPKGCFNIIKSTIKKKQKTVYNKKDLSKKMKRFQRTVVNSHQGSSYHGNSVAILAEL